MSNRAVSQIAFDPTNSVLVTTSDGQLTALEMIKTEFRYAYVEMGNNQFATIKYSN